jgi:predicted MFS family arabinose efflux permease
VRPAEYRLATLIALLALLDLMVMLIAVPLVPRFEHDAHLSHLQSGTVLGAYAAAVLVLSLPAGHLADRVGARRLTIAATLLFAVATPLYAFASTFAELLALRLASGVFSAVSWTAGLAWLVASMPGSHRLRALATVNAAASGAAVAGPLVGGPAVAAFGITPTFLAVGAVAVAVAVWALVEPNHGREERHERISARAALATGLRERGFRQANAAMLFMSATASALALLAPVHLHALGIGASGIGWIFTAGSVLSVTAAIALGRAADRIDCRRVARGGCLAVASIVLFLSLGLGAVPYAAGVVLFGGAGTLLWVTTYPMCAEAADRAGIGQGIALGLLNTTWALGSMTAPAAAGFVADHADPGFAFAAAALAGVAAAAALRPDRRPLRPAAPVAATGAAGDGP